MTKTTIYISETRVEPAASPVRVLHTEWTPGTTTITPSTARIRSTWRDARGAMLTNRRILQYERDGRYGPEAQRKAYETDRVLAQRARERRLRQIERDIAYKKEQQLQALLEAKYV